MENKLMKCVSCGAELTERAKFCEKCGHAVEPEKETEQYCSVCGEKIEEGTLFCAKCGHSFKENDNNLALENAERKEDEFSDKEESAEEKAYFEAATEILTNSTEKVEKKGLGKKIKSIISVCVTILVIFLVLSSSARDPIGDTKDIVFDDWTTESIGDIVDEKMSNVTWEKTKNDKNHYTVTVTGFVPDLYGNMTILFDVNYAGDSVYTKIVSMSYDGETYTDAISMAYIMGILTN